MSPEANMCKAEIAKESFGNRMLESIPLVGGKLEDACNTRVVAEAKALIQQAGVDEGYLNTNRAIGMKTALEQVHARSEDPAVKERAAKLANHFASKAGLKPTLPTS